MNARTGLVAIVSLLLALAGAGGAATEQTEVHPATGARSTASRLPDWGDTCPTWGCGENHNETLVRDATPARQAGVSRHATTTGCPIWMCGSNHNETLVNDATSVPKADTLSRWLTSIQEFIFTSFPTSVRGGCDDWGCGMNHNETLVRDAAR